MKIFVLWVLPLFLNASYIYYKANPPAAIENQEEKKEPGSKIRYNGIYADYDTSACSDGNPNCQVISTEFVLFLDEHRILGDDIVGVYPYFEEWSKLHIQKHSGEYHISNDTIYATISTMFIRGGQRPLFLPAHYIGYIKNEDTISGWRMVPPYPKIQMKHNKHFIEKTEPRDLHFVKYNTVKEIKKYIE